MDITLDTAVEVSPGITLEWVSDGKIALFTHTTMARASVDLWAQHMFGLMTEWPTDRPFATLQDSGFQGAAFTPTMRKHSERFITYRPELVMYTALVLPRNMTAQFVQLFYRAMRKPNRVTEIFFTREEAMAWLEKRLAARG
jgi:hypothetical protein